MTAMSFSLRQRTNPHKRKVLLGVGLGVGGDQSHFLFVKEEILTRKKSSWGGGWQRAMSFSLRQRGNPQEEKVLVWGGGGGHQVEYLKMLYY